MEIQQESKIQKYCGYAAKIILVISSLFALYTSGFGLLSAMSQRSIHWLFMVTSIFLLFPYKKGKKIGVAEIILAVVAAAATLYVTLTWQKNALRISNPATWEIVLCIIGICLGSPLPGVYPPCTHFVSIS